MHGGHHGEGPHGSPLVSDPQLAVQVVALGTKLPLWKQSSRNCAHKQLLSCRIRWNCAISTMNLLIWVAPRLHWLRPDLGRRSYPPGSSREYLMWHLLSLLILISGMPTTAWSVRASQSLTKRGFKSFASATTLEFEPGITCVVWSQRFRQVQRGGRHRVGHG